MSPLLFSFMFNFLFTIILLVNNVNLYYRFLTKAPLRDEVRKLVPAQNTMMQSSDDCLTLICVSVSVPLQPKKRKRKIEKKTLIKFIKETTVQKNPKSLACALFVFP